MGHPGSPGVGRVDALDRLRRALRRATLHDLLEDGERLDALVRGSFGPDLQGTGGPLNIARHGSLHKGVGAATDRRVIFLDKGIFATKVAGISYASIESISYSTSIVWAGLKISTRGTTSLRVEMVQSKWSAKAFAAVVESHLNPPDGVRATPKTSTIDDLRKLAELLRMGLVTREEFDAKKSELLGL